MNKTVKRYVLLTIGLFISALGVALTKTGEMGVSPISSVANVMNCRFPEITLGTWLIIWNCILILGQILILKKNFDLIQLLQIPLSFAFGWFTDIGMIIVSFIPADTYIVRIIAVLLGTIVLGFGVALTVIANVLMNSGEAFVKALSDRLKKNFGDVKVGFDISCVILAVIMSLVMFDMKIVGTGVGTLVAALLTGKIVKLSNDLLYERLTCILMR